MDIYQKVGQRLKVLRLKKNLTILKLEKDSDVSYDHLRNITSARKKVTLSTLKKVTDALDVPFASLFPLHWLLMSEDESDSNPEIYLSSEVDVEQLLQILKDQGWVEYKK